MSTKHRFLTFWHIFVMSLALEIRYSAPHLGLPHDGIFQARANNAVVTTPSARDSLVAVLNSRSATKDLNAFIPAVIRCRDFADLVYKFSPNTDIAIPHSDIYPYRYLLLNNFYVIKLIIIIIIKNHLMKEMLANYVFILYFNSYFKDFCVKFWVIFWVIFFRLELYFYRS